MSISVVQTASGSGAGGATATFPNPVASGNTVIAIVASSTNLHAPTNASNVFHTAVAAIQSPGGSTSAVGIYYAYNVTGGSGFAVSTTGESYCCCGTQVNVATAILLYEVSGLGATDPLDQHNSHGITTSGTSCATGTTPVTTQASELDVAAFSSFNFSSLAISGFSNLLAVNNYGAAATKIVAATGAQSGTFTWTSSSTALAAIATFKAGPPVYTDAQTGTLVLAGAKNETHTGADARTGTLALAGVRAEARKNADARAGTLVFSGQGSVMTGAGMAPDFITRHQQRPGGEPAHTPEQPD